MAEGAGTIDVEPLARNGELALAINATTAKASLTS
jgi:hypothetical protein